MSRAICFATVSDFQLLLPRVCLTLYGISPLRISQISQGILSSAIYLHSVYWTRSLYKELLKHNWHVVIHQTLFTSKNTRETLFMSIHLIIYSTSALLNNRLFWMGRKYCKNSLRINQEHADNFWSITLYSKVFSSKLCSPSSIFKSF